MTITPPRLDPALDPEAGGADIDARWRADFEVHRGQHADVTTAGMWTLAPAVRDGLRSSLPTFQLGETGTGRHLLAMARREGNADYVEAMRLFVIEEQEHSRLLAMACEAVDAPLLATHWTDRVFQWARRLLGLRAEVLMLLVAELIAVCYYATLAAGVGDQVLGRIFARIHADELRHLDFHAGTLPRHLARWSTPTWWCARVVWTMTVIGSAVVVAWDHRQVLRACGSGPTRFLIGVLRLLRFHEGRFFDRSTRVTIEP